MRPDLTEDERDEQAVLALRELLQRFGDPVKRTSKVIPLPKPHKKRPQPKPGPSLKLIAADHTPGC
jgi:hypothetical protein